MIVGIPNICSYRYCMKHFDNNIKQFLNTTSMIGTHLYLYIIVVIHCINYMLIQY